MTRGHARIYATLLDAYASGRTIQCNTHGAWVDGDTLNFGLSPDHYRIKPEPHDFLWAVQQVREETGYTCLDSNPTVVLTKSPDGALRMNQVGMERPRPVSIDEALATDWRFHNNGE